MNRLQILIASNSDAAVHMAEARNRLKNIFPHEIRFSDNLESNSVNDTNNIDVEESTYLNAICQAFTELSVESVRSLLKKIESEMARKRGVEAKGLIAIDLDLVIWNKEILRPKDIAQKYYQDCWENFNKIYSNSDLG